jgi:hypothetical protein
LGPRKGRLELYVAITAIAGLAMVAWAVPKVDPWYAGAAIAGSAVLQRRRRGRSEEAEPDGPTLPVGQTGPRSASLTADSPELAADQAR